LSDSDALRAQICAETATWLGTPYVHKGRTKGVAADCGGLLYEVYNKFMGPLPPFPDDYPPDWAMHDGKERYLDFVEPLFKAPVSLVQPGGFSLFHLGLAMSHAAIYVGDGKYIHSWGRNRMGSVTKTPSRVMLHMARGNVRHYDPVVSWHN
jgi:NlpC/P60 family putative phage cell wall peptidase